MMKKRSLTLAAAFLFCLTLFSAAFAGEVDEEYPIDDAVLFAAENDPAAFADGFEAEEYTDENELPFLTGTAGAHPPRLVDNADLLSVDEENTIGQMLDEISLRRSVDVVIVTESTLDGKDPMDYADDFFDYNGYGMGCDADGVLLLVSMEERDYWISTSGYGIYAFTDYGIDRISEDFLPSLSAGDYYGAFQTFISDCDHYIGQALDGSPIDGSADRSVKGKFPLVKDLGIALLIGLVIALIVSSNLKNKMKTVRMASDASDYARDGSLRLREQRDVFLFRNVTKTEIPKERSGGGSSTHTSSSGSTHGGGGGKF